MAFEIKHEGGILNLRQFKELSKNFHCYAWSRRHSEMLFGNFAYS